MASRKHTWNELKTSVSNKGQYDTTLRFFTEEQAENDAVHFDFKGKSGQVFV